MELVRPDGQLVNASRSQRAIAELQEQVQMLQVQVQHLRGHLAVVVAQTGGEQVVKLTDLREAYDIEAKPLEDESGIVWKSKKTPPKVAADA